MGFFHSWVQASVFTVGIFSQLGFSPPISALADRGSVFTDGIFSQLGFPPPILALSDRGSIFTVGTASTDLGTLRWGEHLHSWDFFMGLFYMGVFSLQV